MAHNRQHNTGRFMSEDMWNEKIPDRPYMTDEEGNYLSPAQRAEADAEFARQGKLNSSTGSGGYGKKRVGEESRKQMNLTGNRRSSILTTNK